MWREVVFESVALFLTLSLTFFLAGGIAAFTITSNAEVLEKCRRANNVYACKMVAIPVEVE